MRAEEYRALQEWFENYLAGFRENGALHPMLELKRVHSLRVAENAALLAAMLRAGPAELRLARAAGLLHDVGRFGQFRSYGSLRDSDTVDHAAEGRRVLEAQAAGLVKDERERARLLGAVQFHNRKTSDIPAEEGRDVLLKLLRDADKLDIMEVVLRSVTADGFRDLPEMLPHIGPGREPSPGLLAKAAGGKGLSSGELRTVADMLLLTASWFYDLNYPAAHWLAARRGLLARLRRELPGTREVGAFFSGLETWSGSAANGKQEEKL